MLLWIGAAPAQQAQLRPAEPAQPATVRVRQRILIRVTRISIPRTPIASAAPLPPISWVEQRSEQCVPMESLAGAAITRPDSVDLVLAGGKRMRAKLDGDCPALGFYQGFTVARTSDGRLCAQRDTIRSASGSTCRIEGFRSLVPAR
ncbi:hypothetical protein [Sphingomonas qomolangmaensis]|uniref:Uncharacterized protein n=1 Tax=Sphingomonas qomolangmaensis TaxID=2918765 RepID=A0ABY5L6Y9_9SPHN|nr:hypothetical protein [Sphingomonas qomolangmaensis]UUL82730.1 hypothetical protein NMP03_00305 [Sphingomonas qomolangmaensis]